MASSYGSELLKRQFIELSKNPPDGMFNCCALERMILPKNISTNVLLSKQNRVSVGLGDDGNIFCWELMIIGPPETLYEGGFFNAKLVFPPEFPNLPPVMTFQTKIWHPNVYEDGRVCISILHPPGEDRFNELETAAERWRPILGVEQIIISVISMLSDPNDDSPANIDAAVMWRTNRDLFKKKVKEIVRRSQEGV